MHRVQFDKSFHKSQHLVTWWLYPARVRALVKAVKYDVDWYFSSGGDDVLEADCQCANTRLLCAIVCGIKTTENVVDWGRIRLVVELDYERGEKSTGILLPDILEIEKEECYVR